ncbi:MAG: ErpK protein [Lachnospiraceae bacterium]|nr:ErpK protein [Lachnospiraceae bacterium]
MARRIQKTDDRIKKARRTKTIDDRIKKAEEAVIRTKEKYDAALEELNLLVKKKKEMESKELMKAFEKSDRSLEEVLEFLGGKADKDEDA